MLLWAATDMDFLMWTQAFKDIIIRNEHKVFKKCQKIEKNQKNAFVMTLYEALKPSLN